MALVTNNISGSSSDASKIGITGSVIIANSPDAQFPRLGTDAVFFVSGSETAKSVFGGAAKISGSLSTDGNVALGNSADDTLNVAGEATFSKSVTATENVVAGIDLKSNFSSGDEGGQIFLNKAVTNTTINTGVTIDVYQDKLRFFENGGTARGYYIDITAGGAGAGTNLVGGGGGGAPTGAQYVTLATNASLTDERVLTAGTGITLTDGGAGSTITAAINNAVVATVSGTTFTGAISAPGITSTAGLTQSGGNVSLTAQTNGSVSIGNDSGTTATAILGGAGVILSGTTGTNYTVGGETGTGTITLGRSTASNTINIGAGTTASAATQTVNIATSATGTGKALVSIGNAIGASGLILSAGTANISLTGATTTAYSIGSSSGTGTITVGQSTASNTINIGSAGNSTLSNQAINIGAGAGRSTVTIGATTGASSLTLDAGTGTINIGSSASARTINIGPINSAGGSAISHTVNIGDLPSNASSVTTVSIGTAGAGVTQNTITIGNYGSTAASVTTIHGDTIVLTNSTTSGDRVGIGTTGPAVKLDVVSDHSTNYAARVWNDGNNADRYGLYIQCGTDASTGTNYAIGIHDGDGGNIGYVTFSGATVTYGAFTGDHYAKIIDPGTEKIYGTILKIVSASTSPSGSKKVDYIVEKTSTAKDPAVFGAYSGDFSGAPDESLRDCHSIFCLGDGHVLVTDQGGNINIGDYICSSDSPGHGMKQDDDLLHSYTVAKATQAIDFSAIPIDPVRGYKSVLICCTYHGA